LKKIRKKQDKTYESLNTLKIERKKTFYYRYGLNRVLQHPITKYLSNNNFDKENFDKKVSTDENFDKEDFSEEKCEIKLNFKKRKFDDLDFKIVKKI